MGSSAQVNEPQWPVAPSSRSSFQVRTVRQSKVARWHHTVRLQSGPGFLPIHRAAWALMPNDCAASTFRTLSPKKQHLLRRQVVPSRGARLRRPRGKALGSQSHLTEKLDQIVRPIPSRLSSPSVQRGWRALRMKRDTLGEPRRRAVPPYSRALIISSATVTSSALATRAIVISPAFCPPRSTDDM